MKRAGLIVVALHLVAPGWTCPVAAASEPGCSSSTGATVVTSNDVFDFHPIWSPGGRSLAWESSIDGENWIFVRRSDGSEKKLAKGDHPKWMPDGTSVVYESDRAGEGTDIYLTDHTGVEIRLTEEAGDDGGAMPSPDGRRIAYLAKRDDHWKLRVLELGSGTRTDLLDWGPDHFAPSWKADGTALLFMSRHSGTWDIWSWTLDRDPLPVVASDAEETSPHWLPSGDLVYIAADGGMSSLRVLEDDGTTRILVETADRIDWYAASPNARFLAYTVGDDRQNRIEILDLLTGVSTMIVPAEGRNVAPAWSADSDALAWATNRDGDFDIYAIEIGMGASR